MTTLSSQQADRYIKQGRSAVTNGKRALIGVNGSSKYGRRFADLVADYTKEIGGPLSATDQAMIKQAAALAVRGEQLQADIVNGVEVDSDALIRLTGAARRILTVISAKAAKRKPAAVNLDTYLAGIGAE